MYNIHTFILQWYNMHYTLLITSDGTHTLLQICHIHTSFRVSAFSGGGFFPFESA